VRNNLAQTSARFDRAFAAVAGHFRMTKEDRARARRYARLDYARACRCYYAIARSLRA
jgi:hypothetical protein